MEISLLRCLWQCGIGIPSHTNLGILILTLLLLLAGAYVIYQRRRSVLNVE